MTNKFLKDSIYVVETNIDDMNPVLYETVFEKLYEAGALEVFLTPIQMKKVRPGVLLTALVPKNRLRKIIEIIFRQTTSFGVRYHEVRRLKLIRKKEEDNLGYGKVRINKGYIARELVSISPEYNDCRKLASKKNIALKDMLK